jgi:hypothetical protein
MATLTIDRPVTEYQARATSSMVTVSTKRIFHLNARLRHDLEHPERKCLLADIREIRSALSRLEREVLGEVDTVHGDAC